MELPVLIHETRSHQDTGPVPNVIKDPELWAYEIRRLALSMIFHAGSGHPGGCLSCADIMAYLWSVELQLKCGGVREPNLNEDHRFVLSKGHSCPSLYAAGALGGRIPFSQLAGFRKLGSPLQGHPDVRSLPWTQTSTGSLGQGFSAAIGMALGFRHQGQPTRVYVMVGDGELQEGMVWEGAMCAGHYQLGNICAIVDYNKMQSDDLNSCTMGLEPLRAKWEAFNWHVIEINGHDCDEIEMACVEARTVKEKPTVIVAHTIKGKGVSYMEGDPLWHGSVKLRQEELVEALQDLHTPEETFSWYLDGHFN